MRAVPYLLAFAAAFVFASLLPAAFVAFAAGEWVIGQKMVLQAVFGGSVASLVMAAGIGKTGVLSRYDSFFAIVSLWIFTPLVAAWVLIWIGDMALLDALFEAVGGLTTSGATVFTERAALPVSLLFWRVELEWLGGYLTLMGIIEVLAPAGLGGRPQTKTVYQRTFMVGVPARYGRMVRVFLQYCTATFVIGLLMILTGSDFGDAAMLSMIAVATGGFVPFDGAILDRVGLASTAILALGLCVGATSVFWRSTMIRSPRRLIQLNPETLWAFGIIGALSVFFASRLATVSGTNWALIPSALIEGVFAAASLVSTSGLQSREGIFTLAPEIVVLFTVYIGASIHSTGGGIKLYRLGAMAMQASHELERLIYPSSVSPLKIGGLPIAPSSMRAVWVYVFLLLGVTAAGTAFASIGLGSFDISFAYTVALVSNAAPVYEALAPVGGQWPVHGEIPPLAQIAGIGLMLLGRLEILAVFAVFNFKYWIER